MKRSEFIGKVSAQIKDMPTSELENICLALARHIPERSYDEALEEITKKNDSAHSGIEKETAALLTEIKNLCEAVENGEYSFPYEYDPSDEWWDDNGHFVDENGLSYKINDYIEDIIFYIKRKQYAAAFEGFHLLLSIECCDELGEDVNLLRLLGEDRLRADAKTIAEYYAYTALMTLRGQDRIHEICRIAQLFPKDMEISEVLYTENFEIPDLNSFLDDWISFLMDESSVPVPPRRESLLVNAVITQGGTPGLQAFAEKHGAKYPLAFIELIRAYAAGGQPETAIAVAKKGLAQVQGISPRRTEIADLLTEISGEQQNEESMEHGLIEGFRSALDLKHFVSLYQIGRVDVIDKTFKYFTVHAKKDLDFFRICALYGDYEAVWNACHTDAASLGWTYSDKGKLFPVLIALLSGASEFPPSIEKLLQDSFNFYDSFSADFIKILAAHKKDLPEETRRQYSRWCKDQVRSRVDAIVSGQHRGSYGKAALITCAMAESIKPKEGAQAALQYVQSIKGAYPKHSSFQRELREALKIAELQV